MTIDKDKETATDSTSFIYNPVLAGIYKNAVEDMGDVPCTFDSVLVLKPGTDVLKQNLVSNTFYYLEEGNYLTNYQINIPSCTIIMGANDKVNLYATKAGAFGAMLSVEDK